MKTIKLIITLLTISLAGCTSSKQELETGPVKLTLTNAGMNITKAEQNESLAKTVQMHGRGACFQADRQNPCYEHP